jgi:triosephosphate isomerase
MIYFVINTKNYPNSAGPSIVRLSSIVDSISRSQAMKLDVQIILAVPAFSIALLSERFPGLTFFAQHLDDAAEGSTTGFLVAEIAKTFGAKGSIINHSEHRIPDEKIRITVEILRKNGLLSLVCARNEDEVSSFAKYSPDFLAVEPPELIGSGNAISKSRPELITRSVDALRTSKIPNSSTALLCGAGIVDSEDAKRSVELGAQGILVASGVIKSSDWKVKIGSLVQGLTSSIR